MKDAMSKKDEQKMKEMQQDAVLMQYAQLLNNFVVG